MTFSMHPFMLCHLRHLFDDAIDKHGYDAVKSIMDDEKVVTSEMLESWLELFGARIPPSPSMLVSLVLRERRITHQDPFSDSAEARELPAKKRRREIEIDS